MSRIRTTRRDVSWSYIGTFFSMGSNFLLLPLLLVFLDGSELGLWYIFLSISNLTMLFEFGFSPAFARNIVYCKSGVSELKSRSVEHSSASSAVDYRLLATLLKSTKRLYLFVSLAALVLCATVGSAYFSHIGSSVPSEVLWPSWAVVCAAIFLNLYYLYVVTFLRGFGDVASENKAKAFGRLIQIVLTCVLLVLGWGLLGAALGYLANGLSMRLIALIFFRRHSGDLHQIDLHYGDVAGKEVYEVVRTISNLAVKDGVVQIALFASTQAMAILCSLFLELSETAVYALMLQFATAVFSLAAVYYRSFLPMFQSAFAENNLGEQRGIVARCSVVYLAVSAVFVFSVALLVPPVLRVFEPDLAFDPALFFALSFYLLLFNYHSMCCGFIISRNEIPYAGAYVISAILGIALTCIFEVATPLGPFGIVLGQALVQIAYNNWRWPLYLSAKVESNPIELIQLGFKMIVGKTVGYR